MPCRRSTVVGRLVVERPEIELQPVVADLPVALARQGLGRRIERGALLAAGCRWMKSKMPCEPGPAPLMKLAQATGLCGGMLVPSLLKPPAARSLARLGSRPASIMLSRQAGVHAVDADHDDLLAQARATRDGRRPANSAAAGHRGAADRRGRCAFEERSSLDRSRSRFGHHATWGSSSVVARGLVRRQFGRLADVQRLAVHVVGHRDAEHVQHRGADVQQPRLLGLDLAVAEQHARDERRIDAMVAAPGLRVVVEDLAVVRPMAVSQETR